RAIARSGIVGPLIIRIKCSVIATINRAREISNIISIINGTPPILRSQIFLMNELSLPSVQYPSHEYTIHHQILISPLLRNQELMLTTTKEPLLPNHFS